MGSVEKEEQGGEDQDSRPGPGLEPFVGPRIEIGDATQGPVAFVGKKRWGRRSRRMSSAK